LTLGSYDLAVDLRYFDDNRILLLHTDARYRAGYAAAGIPLDLALPAGPENGMMAHIGGRTQALAAAVAWTFGVPAGGAREGLMKGRDPVRLFKEGIVVGISPGTRNELRSWGRERFAELARLLCSEQGFRIVLIGGDSDRSDTQFIAELLPKTHVIDLAGTLAIGDVPPVFAGLDLFIGGETGTTHMAALLGVPTICIYSGQTNVDSWRPVGEHVVTLRGNVMCSPCYLATAAECPWNKRCMDIPPVRVAAEVIAMRERSLQDARSTTAITGNPALVAREPVHLGAR
jgi:ADP-heptose:LPS heptosyltransferase